MKKSYRVRCSVAVVMCSLAIIVLCVWTPTALTYTSYSQNGGDATNCGTCHGDFRDSDYVSNGDGMNWGNLHNLHRADMLNFECDACHGQSRLPTLLNASNGGNGLAPISCVGCHGRAEDNVATNPEVGAGRTGYGAGLRQHHFVTGVTGCADCHLDANPASYTPVNESVPPVYYADPGTNHPDIPASACGPGDEDFAGSTDGLDNDGDDLYEMADDDCLTPVESATWGAIKATFTATD